MSMSPAPISVQNDVLVSPVGEVQALSHDAFLRLDHYELNIKGLAGLNM